MVVAILGILAGVVVFASQGIGDRGRAAAVAIDERIITTAQEAYCAKHGRYAEMGDAGTPGTLVGDGFLSEPSTYHEVTVTNDGTGPCNGSRYELTPTAAAGGTTTTAPGGGGTTTTTAPPARVNTWAPLGGGPPAVYGATMAEHPPTGTVVMFGGLGKFNSRPTGETWIWNGAWVLAVPEALDGCKEVRTSPTPCPSEAHSMAYDAARQQVVLVGGTTNWSDTTTPGNIGTGRQILETWLWDGLRWTYAGAGPDVTGATAAYDPVSQTVVLVGGRRGGTEYRSGTLLWNGSSWQAVPGPAPPPRIFGSMAYDPVSRRVILFGGWSRPDPTGPDSHLDDTWAWDGATRSWSRLSPAGQPSAREGAAAASNPSGRLVLFGGIAPDFTDETWIWTGSTWAIQNPDLRPPSRANAAMAYHAPSGQYVMFGGRNATPLVAGLADAWGYVNNDP